MGKFIAWCAIVFGLLVLWGTADEVAVRPHRLAEMAKMKAKLDAMPSIPDEKVPIAF